MKTREQIENEFLNNISAMANGLNQATGLRVSSVFINWVNVTKMNDINKNYVIGDVDISYK